MVDDILEQASQNMSVNFAPMLKKKLTGSAKGMKKRKPGQSKTGKKKQKQRVNKETQNRMDEVLNQVLETANLAIRKINESSQEVVTNRDENQCTINDQSMSNSNTNDQNDQSVTNEIESHHIFF